MKEKENDPSSITSVQGCCMLHVSRHDDVSKAPKTAILMTKQRLTALHTTPGAISLKTPEGRAGEKSVYCMAQYITIALYHCSQVPLSPVTMSTKPTASTKKNTPVVFTVSVALL